MLDDTSRKLLLIMNHYKRHFGRLPGLQELERLSGRQPVSIKRGLAVLAQENYIEWDPRTPPEAAVIIEGWERDNPAHKTPQTGTQQPGHAINPGNTDYWQYY